MASQEGYAARRGESWLTLDEARALLSHKVSVDSLRTSIQLGEELVLGRASGRLVVLQAGQELLLSDQLRYVPRLSGDELQDGTLRWKIDRKLKAQVCELVARHRLALPFEPQPLGPSLTHPYMIGPFEWWPAWLQSQCQPGESLLASLPTGESQDIESAYDERESVPVHWVWTSRRVFLAYAGRLGDAKCQALTRPVNWESGVLKGALVSEQQRHAVSGKHAKAIQELQSLANQDPWLWHASFVAWVLGAHGPEQARALAESKAYQGDQALDLIEPIWRAPDACQELELDASKGPLLLELWSNLVAHAKLDLSPPNRIEIPELDDWLAKLESESLLQDDCFETSWPIGRMLGRLCLAWRDQAELRSLLVMLLDKVRESFEPPDDLAKVESKLAQVCVFARLYQECQAPDKAHACYMELIEVLPDAQDLELVLGQEHPQAPLRHLLDALVQQALQLWPDNCSEREALLALAASLIPLDLPRLQAWMDACAPGSEAQLRIERTAGQLRNLGQGQAQGLPDQPRHRLRPSDLESRLVHPAVRSSTTGSLQAMLAKLDRPDHSALKKYCDPGQEGVLAKEIERVAYLFDKDPVDVFISHGDRRYGIQAFEGDPAFLLVGGEHRRPESPAYLNPDELRFTLGAELAHLYLGHARVTSQEVLSGALDKGKLTFELLTSVVPFVSAFPWGRRLGQLAGYFDNKLVSRSAQRIRDYFGASEDSTPAALTLDRSVGLIAAHRMMQLTADRAGLLCSGDLGACIVAMWKLRPESAEHLELLRTKGVIAATKALFEDDDDLWRSLATRAAALTTFAWSEEYEGLRSWCWSEAGS